MKGKGIDARLEHLRELEEEVIRVHDTYSPADPEIDRELGFALVHLRSACAIAKKKGKGK